MDSREYGYCRRVAFIPIKGMLASIAMLCLLILGCAPEQVLESHSSPVTQNHIREINQLFKDNHIFNGHVVLDNKGRVELQGGYQDELEVDKAFSLAQTVVGPLWVSPVTPENIKVTEWAKCISVLMSGKSCGPYSTAAPADETPPGPIANKYALIVGVGQFLNHSEITTLKYAGDDANAIYSYLINPQGGNFRKENVILLRDEQATLAAIERALNELKQRAQKDDLVFLYLSSHGTPPDKYGGVHVVTYDTVVKPREQVWTTSLTENKLGEFIQNVKAKRLVVIMDACYSSGAYSHIPGFLPTGGKSLGIGDDEGYGRSRLGMAKRILGAKDLFIEQDTATLAQTDKAAKGWGKVLISASDEQQRSWESNRLHNSFFTYYFVEGLQRYQGSIKEAFDYAKPLVQMGVKQEKEVNQDPQLTPSRRDWNMSVAI